MVQDMYSVEQVAERLGLHVRTVRNYIRDGRLKAVRIGKQYRIAPEDVAALTGGAIAPLVGDDVPHNRHVEVSSVVQIDAISPEDASRLSNAVIAVASSRREPSDRLRVDAIYDPERGSLKLILIGGARDCAALLEMVSGILERQGG